MVTHYTGKGGKIACGRSNHDLVSTSDVNRVRCKTCLGSQFYQQGVWFGEFQSHTGTEAMGLEEWAAGTMPFTQAAQHSLACYLMEAQEVADRLERALDPLTL